MRLPADRWNVNPIDGSVLAQLLVHQTIECHAAGQANAANLRSQQIVFHQSQHCLFELVLGRRRYVVVNLFDRRTGNSRRQWQGKLFKQTLLLGRCGILSGETLNETVVKAIAAVGDCQDL